MERRLPNPSNDWCWFISPSLDQSPFDSKRGRVFVDNEAALVGAFERDVMSRDEIVGNSVELIRGEKVGRRDTSEITVFKSVGSAVVDLLGAQLVHESCTNAQVYE